MRASDLATILLGSTMLLSGACIEIQEAFRGALIDTVDTATGGLLPLPPATGDQPDGTSDGITVPSVSLTVSNGTPQVNEAVTLRCEPTGGDRRGLTFDFQPAGELSSIDRNAGTATLIVDQTDVNVAFSFTCTATNEAGTSAPSRPQVVLPTS